MGNENSYNILVEKFEDSRVLGDLGVNGRIILNCTLDRQTERRSPLGVDLSGKLLRTN
jgi:hypothetical protein